MKNTKMFQFARVLVSFELFLVSVTPVSAGLFSPPKPPGIPQPSQMASEVEQRYHVNTEAVQDQGENLNVAGSKKATPEVSLFFSPADPKEGEEITARSFPTYFSTDTSKLYFTWYLQRAGCGPGNPATPQCDLDGNGLLNHNDWKIAAHRILASNDLDLANINYGADTDNDGYMARFGGDNRVNVPNHCYFHDNTTGENYELSSGSGSITWDNCTGEAVCMVASTYIDPGTIDASAVGGDVSGGGSTGGTSLVSGSTFVTTPGPDYVAGTPYCNADGTVGCSTGTPCCVSNAATANSCDQLVETCSRSGDVPNPICRHLFPQARGYWNGNVFIPVGGLTAGDGTYGASEEQVWQTDPRDPDTSGNGNKDEANVVGLGRDTFTWNYLSGDRVGVVVEGTSMVPTKHQDSSNMIMWAFSKNQCKPAGGTGSYTKTIKGYQVLFPTIDMDLNDCIADNLVDPTEGGQATNLELSVTAFPDDPLNDVSDRGDGDLLEVVASVVNAAREMQNMYYDWNVELSSNGTANPPANGWVNITANLNSLSGGRKLLSQVKGNGTNKIQLRLNMRSGDQFNGRAFSTYLSNNIGYLRFRVSASESFGAAGASRRGRSDVIVKFNATQDRILAHTVTVAGDPARVSLNAANEICSGIVKPAESKEQQALTRLDAKLCRVIKNEIIGLEVLGAELSNFNWTINGQPLICNTKVSTAQCRDDQQGRVNFFPVVGNVGDTFTIAVTANEVGPNPALGTSKEKVVTLSRTFKIVQPSVNIVSNDETVVWPKMLGQYVDTDGKSYPEFSKDTLETFPGNTVSLRALFTPDFLGGNTPPQVERSWSVDGTSVADGAANTISFPADKVGKSVYNVSLAAVYRPSTLTRQAMEDIWGLSALDTTEIYFSSTTQVEQPDMTTIASTGMKKYYALIASYLPGSVLFSLKVLFSVFLILFASGVVFALIPNVPDTPPARGRRT